MEAEKGIKSERRWRALSTGVLSLTLILPIVDIAYRIHGFVKETTRLVGTGRESEVLWQKRVRRPQTNFNLSKFLAEVRENVKALRANEHTNSPK